MITLRWDALDAQSNTVVRYTNGPPGAVIEVQVQGPTVVIPWTAISTGAGDNSFAYAVLVPWVANTTGQIRMRGADGAVLIGNLPVMVANGPAGSGTASSADSAATGTISITPNPVPPGQGITIKWSVAGVVPGTTVVDLGLTIDAHAELPRTTIAGQGSKTIPDNEINPGHTYKYTLYADGVSLATATVLESGAVISTSGGNMFQRAIDWVTDNPAIAIGGAVVALVLAQMNSGAGRKRGGGLF